MSDNNKAIAVLGGGISGLSIGYGLKKAGLNVTVYEKGATPGGVMQSERVNGWLTEKGPNTLLARNKKLWDFFEELNLTDHIKEANDDAKKRYIVRNEVLHAVPSSLPGFLSSRLLSPTAKLRLLKEPFIPSSNKKDETIASFISRRFGQEPLDYGVNPFVAGVYAGDPEKISIRHTFSSLHKMEQTDGSVFKGFFKKNRKKSSKKALISFDEGLKVLPRRLMQNLRDSLRLKTEVTGVSKSVDEWTVKARAADKGTTRNYAAVVSTLPPFQLAKIWDETKSKKAINKLSAIEYAPVSVLSLGFRKKQIKHPLDGFGFLVPEKEGFQILGCLFSSSLFPDRAPVDHALLTCFIGGTRKPHLAGQSTEKLISVALKDLNKLLRIEGKPLFSRHIYWPRAIPQFNIGYDSFLNAASAIESQNSGFFLGGNYISGVSISDCILASFKMTEKVKNFLPQKH